jgi:protein SCO1/2
MQVSWTLLVAAALTAAACGSAPEVRQYELTGQILAVRPDRSEVVIAHEDIGDFMRAMTMPFKVREQVLLSGKQPGDLVTATLVVEERDGQLDAYLSVLTTTGHTPLETPPPAETPEILREGDEAEDAPLIDQDGRARPLSSFRGHRVALTFIYTRCPLTEFCPLMDRNFVAVQKAISSTPSLADVRLVTVTFDPEFDTPAVLKTHARRRQADPAIWSFLTGTPEHVGAFARQFGIYAEKSPQSAIDITHNLRTAVIGPDGRLVAVHSGNSWTPAELVADLEAAPAPAN